MMFAPIIRKIDPVFCVVRFGCFALSNDSSGKQHGGEDKQV